MRAGNWERVVFVRDYQHEIAKMTDQRGQKRKQLTLDLLYQGKRKPKETTIIPLVVYTFALLNCRFVFL